MSITERFYEVKHLLNHSIEHQQVPGVVAWLGRYDNVLFRYHYGYAQIYGVKREMTPETVFDLASLTKVVATLPAVLLLVQTGQLSLEAFLSRYFSAFQDGMKSKVRVIHLLTHTAGLISHRPFYEEAQGFQEIVNRVASEPLRYEPGTRVVYSDLGFMLLGALVEKISGQSLSDFCTQQIFEPLGMHQTRFQPAGEKIDFAATEVVDSHPLVGIVHDENARAMGGIAGHAGLFSTAQDLSRYLAMWVGREGPLKEIVKDRALDSYTTELGGVRGLGWVLRRDSYDIAGDLWPETTVSHSGFTGTSLVFDRASGYWAILLTNRVHFGRQTEINDFRRRFHNVAAACLFG
ncbi:serine hydrolase domain-containing protein [Sulfobacillus thermosulfidooxidans]|uniref:serine hydrolase domain-containing protein n=1 Tax=Sulfobacillus thermosulfidooxidans TaxID=28034 RepID=UPI0006B407AB|nr:serine hydrolase domain-containing protein [Sulfobacillus thermosulfidooxidans]